MKQPPVPEGFHFGWSMQRAEKECARRGLSIGRGEYTLSCVGPKIGEDLGLPAANELLLTFCDGELCSVTLAWMSSSLSHAQAARSRAALEVLYGPPGEDGWGLVHGRKIYVVVPSFDGGRTDLVTYLAPAWHSSSKPEAERRALLTWKEPKGWTPKDVGGVPLTADRAAILDICRRGRLEIQAHADEVVCEGALRSMFGVSKPERMAFRFCDGRVLCEVRAYYWAPGPVDALREALTRIYGPSVTTDESHSWNEWGAWEVTLYELSPAVLAFSSRARSDQLRARAVSDRRQHR